MRRLQEKRALKSRDTGAHASTLMSSGSTRFSMLTYGSSEARAGLPASAAALSAASSAPPSTNSTPGKGGRSAERTCRETTWETAETPASVRPQRV